MEENGRFLSGQTRDWFAAAVLLGGAPLAVLGDRAASSE
jgi:hypothetical protein